MKYSLVKRNLKIVIVGDFVFDIYENAFFTRLTEMGHDVKKFLIHDYLPFTHKNGFRRLYAKFQYKYNLGPSIRKLNSNLCLQLEEFNPDMVFIYRGKHIYPKTLLSVKNKLPSTKIFNYNNDDPFAKKYPKYYWTLYKKGITYYDHVFCYRQKNIQDLANLNYYHTSLLLPYYMKEQNNFQNKNFKGRKNQVVFIGHFENDGRDEAIKLLMDNGIEVRLFGTGWKKSIFYEDLTVKNGVIKSLNSQLYNQELNNSKISLVFLSKINNDSYTRRCFEIPATGCVMVSERTEELMKLFKEGEEIVFFDNKIQLLDKIRKLLADEDLLENIGKKALTRLMTSSHEIEDRVNSLLKVYFTTTEN